MSEEANEHAQQAEVNASKAAPPPKFDPDPALVEESLRHEVDRRKERRLIISWPKDERDSPEGSE